MLPAQLGSRMRLRLAIGVALVVVLYNEWLSSIVSRQDWVHLSGADSALPADERVRLLLVADPQIQGFLLEPAGVTGALTRWDADRFLRRSFASALSFVEPDVVLFLGDLTDEGSIASEAHFNAYKTRFFNLFQVSDDAVKVINIPGDNDIGGEGGDPVTAEKARRFHSSFGRETYVEYKFVEFIKINLLTGSEDYKDIPAKSEDKIRIILTHVPLLPSSDSTVQKILPPSVNKVISRLNPDLVISAHEHLARLMESGGDSVRLRSIDSMEQKGRVWRIDTRNVRGGNGGLYEIQVPTCSYRMGVPRSGYGSAIISSNGRVKYTVLWLPGRFPQLYFYLAAILFIVVLFLPLLISQCWLLVIQSCLGLASSRHLRSRVAKY